MQKYNEYTNLHLLSYYAQAFYCFPIENSSWLSGIEPAIRWDQIGEEIKDNGFGVSRITTGVNFNLKTGNFKSVFRINYEHFFNDEVLVTMPKFADRANKVTAEIMFAF